jgi:membrane protein required for colicin V production
MNWLDVVIVATLIWFALTGLSTGLLRESVTFLAALAGVILAGLLYERLANDLLVFNISDRTSKIIAFLSIFAAVFLAGQIGAVLLKRAASMLMLGPFDHTAGLVLGILKGFILIEAALILFALYPIDFLRTAMNGSLLTPFFLEGLPVLLNVLPGEFREAVEQFKP